MNFAPDPKPNLDPKTRAIAKRMNHTKTKSSSIKDEESNRFYRLNRDGKWQKKTRTGDYVLTNPKQLLRRLQLLAARCSRRIE